MSKTISFTKKELELLCYIVTMYGELHEDSWKESICSEDKPLVESMISKLGRKP